MAPGELMLDFLHEIVAKIINYQYIVRLHKGLVFIYSNFNANREDIKNIFSRNSLLTSENYKLGDT